MVQNTSYVGISGQLSIQRRLNSIAQNMANVNTAGFRAKGLKFDKIISDKASDYKDKPVFVSAGKSYLDTRPGAIEKSSNPLDIALIDSKAWLSLQTENGVVYTRDGRMNMTPDGLLVSVKGYPYLDETGQPIQIKPNLSAPVITKDGVIYQDGKAVASIGLYSFPQGSRLYYAPNSSVRSDKPPLPIDDRSATEVAQGFIEKSNVNGVIEMTNLINVQRSFEQMDALLRTEHEQDLDAIKTLGNSY